QKTLTKNAIALSCFAAAIASIITLLSSPALVSPITIIFLLMSFCLLSFIVFILFFFHLYLMILFPAPDLLLRLQALYLPLFQRVKRFPLFLFLVPVHLHLDQDHLFPILPTVSFSPS